MFIDILYYGKEDYLVPLVKRTFLIFIFEESHLNNKHDVFTLVYRNLIAQTEQ